MIKEIFFTEKYENIYNHCNKIKSLIKDVNKIGWYKKYILDNNYITILSEKEYIRYDNICDFSKEVLDILCTFNEFNKKYVNDINEISIEFHYANSEKNYPSYPWTVIHCDNDNFGINKVITIIFYFDVNCEEGELCFYEDDKIVEKINVKDKILIFYGDILHNPEEMKNGNRYCISFQIKYFE